jgi:excisionase family DNA binding protein
MDFITVREAAERLKVARATIYALCAGARLAHLRVGRSGRGTIRITEQDLATFIDQATIRRVRKSD